MMGRPVGDRAGRIAQVVKQDEMDEAGTTVT